MHNCSEYYLYYFTFLDDIPPDTTIASVSILDQLSSNDQDPGVANFARIPLTKFKMEEQKNSGEEPDLAPPELVTFAPNAVTISAINNEGVTRLLEVVRINKPEELDEDLETIDAINNDGNTRQLEIVEIKRPPGIVDKNI